MTEITEARFARYAAAHQDPKGAGDARPTGLQIVQDENMLDKLRGKNILITGASAGIGVEAARALHATGANLFLPVRNLAKGEEVRRDILSTSSAKGDIQILQLDLTSFASVRKCVTTLLRKTDRLNVLINNAGIMANPELEITEDQHEIQFQSNYLSHFLLFQLLKPTLLSSSTSDFPSRVVCVASSGHRGGGVLFNNLDFAKGGYSGGRAYASAKTAVIYMANQIERLYGAQGLHATSVNVGGIATGLQKHFPQAIRDSFTSDPETAKIMKTTAQGCATTVWAAIGSEWSNKGGVYLENEAVSPPVAATGHPGRVGYAEHAYDEKAEAQLWEMSCAMTRTSA